MNTLQSLLTASIKSAPTGMLAGLDSSQDAERTNSSIALARRLVAATYRFFKRSVSERRRRLISKAETSFRLAELEDKLFVAIRNTPRETLQRLAKRRSADADSAASHLAARVKIVAQNWLDARSYQSAANSTSACG